jgi:cytochrome c-type biogenesis protein CcmH/NrfG
VLPIASFYLLRNTALSLLLAGLYGLLAAFTLWQALQGRPLIRLRDRPADPPALDISDESSQTGS